MREFGFVSDRVEDIIKELGVSNHTGFLEESNRKIKNILSLDVFYLDIYRHSAASSGVQEWLKRFTDNVSYGYNYFIKDESEYVSRCFSQVMSAASIIAFDETLYNSSSLKEKIKFFSEQYKVTIIINFFDEEKAKQFSLELGNGIKCIILPAGECSDKNAEMLFKYAVPDINTLNKFKKCSYINSIKPIFGALDEVFFSENKAAQTRKLVNAQSTQITKKDELGLNQMELTNNLKQIIQKFGQETDKNLRAKYDELNKSTTGQFSLLGQKEANSLKDFKREIMAEKPEKLAVTIEEEFKENFIKIISQNIQKELDKDQMFIKTELDDIIAKINIQLKLKNIDHIRFEDIDVPMPDKSRIISSYCYFSRQYTGEIVKKGPYEIFISLRDYIGVVMVATGLLAPLNMISSVGDEKEGFFSHFSGLKEMNKYIKFSTACIAISLIVYGIYDLRRRIPRKREEEFNREMIKAKELLQSENKRMCSDATRDWSTGISTWLKDISQNILNQLDKNVKILQIAKADKMNREKNQQQRVQQSADLLQRNIQSAEKIKDQLALRFRDIVTETEKEIKL